MRNGQALWRPDRSKPEIVGDLLLASHPNGRAYLQFSKALPIVAARLEGASWEVEFPPEGKRYAAAARPPARIVWLQLLRQFRGEVPSSNWQVTQPSPEEITFEDSKRGERLEVQF